MKFFKNYLFEISISLIFIVTRVINLGIIPIFTDEAIYTYWSQVALHDPANRYISLEDGKQPLFIWLAAIMQKLIPDPLLAARSVSILAGAASVIGIYLLANHLFGKKVARIASLIYVILPFTLLYDRMALYDSLLTATIIYSVYFSIKLAQKPKVENALLAGIFIGLGLITKSSALLYLVLLPAPLLIFLPKRSQIKKTAITWITLAVLTAFISQVMYNSLRLSPLFYLIARKNLTFIKPISEFIKEPFSLFLPNLNSMINWQVSYLGLQLALFFLGIFIYSLFKKEIKLYLLFIYILFPFFVETFFNTVLYPRFMLFYFPFFIIVTAWGINEISKKFSKQPYINYLLALLLFIYPVANSYFLLTNPTKANIASSDKNQYIEQWPAGFGVKEIVSFLKEQVKYGDVYVATEGTFGLLPYAFKIYFFNQPNPQIDGFWPLDKDDLPLQILSTAKIKKSYVVFNENQKEISNSHLKFIDKFQKGKSDTYMRIYEVK